MRATFFGIEIGKTGIIKSQIGLDVTGHNIANVDTRGYTRQRIVGTAYDPFTTIGRALPVVQARVGFGTRVLIHDQIRSAYLDRRFRTENTINAYWQKRTESFTYVESYFDNVKAETSINYSIEKFFEAIKILAEDTVEGSPRKLLQTTAQDLVQQLGSIYDGLVDLQEIQNKAVEITVGEINRIAEEIKELNKVIYGFEVTGHIALDLRDKRNLLLDDLSAIIDIEYREERDGYGGTILIVETGGRELVNHDRTIKLGVREVVNPIQDEAPVWQVHWVGKGGSWGISLVGDDGQTVNLDLIGVDPNDPNSASDIIAEVKDLVDLILAGTADDDDIDRLKELVKNVDINEDDEVTIGGVAIIGDAELMERPIPAAFMPNSGELKAYIDMRDNAGIDLPGIPRYITMLNDLARALVQEVNLIHMQGWSDPPGSGSLTGISFFNDGGQWQDTTGNERLFFNSSGQWEVQTFNAVTEEWVTSPTQPVPPITDPAEEGYAYVFDLSLITAKNIRLSDAVQTSEFNIAASTKQIVKQGAPEELQRGNNENMNALYELFLKKDIVLDTADMARRVDIGSFEGFVTSIRFDIGNTLSFAKKTADNYNILTIAAENQRTSIAGVSLDEEMTNMIKYQHAYSGSSRVITAMDEMLDKLINGTGRVGL